MLRANRGAALCAVSDRHGGACAASSLRPSALAAKPGSPAHTLLCRHEQPLKVGVRDPCVPQAPHQHLAHTFIRQAAGTAGGLQLVVAQVLEAERLGALLR